MPTYEYRCTECTRHIDVQQSFTDPPKQNCDFCGGKLRRVFSPVGVMFKGSGFYSTDARSDARANARKTDTQGGNGDKRPNEAKTGSTGKETKGGESKAGSGDTPSAPKKATADKKT